MFYLAFMCLKTLQENLYSSGILNAEGSLKLLNGTRVECKH